MRVEQIAESLCEIKGERLTWFEVQGKLDIADHILVCEGRSSAHCRGISDYVELAFKKKNELPQSIEGYETGTWVLMDYGDIVVHIFSPEMRDYYRLDELYAEYQRDLELKGNFG